MIRIIAVLSALCSLLVYPNPLYASRTDSLKNAIIGHNVVDTNYIRHLCELSIETSQVDPEESKKLATRAFEIADSLNYMYGMAFATLGMGLGAWGQEFYEEAMKHFLEAEKLAKKCGNEGLIMYTKFHIAEVYRAEGVIDIANRNYRQLIPYYIETGNRVYLARTYYSYGSTFVFNRLYDRGIELLDSALVIWKSLSNLEGLTACELQKGIAMVGLKKLEEAEHLFNRTLKGFRDLDDERGVIVAQREIGNAYLAAEMRDSAEVYLMTALKGAQKYAMEEDMYGIYLKLYELESGRRNFEKALEYYKAHTGVFDKRLNTQISYQVHELKMKYDKEKNEQQIKLLSQEKKVQNAYIVSLSLLIIVISISAVLVALTLRNNRRKDALLNESKQALMLAEISNAKLKEKELKVELEKRDLQLTSYTMNFIQKGTVLNELQEKLAELDLNGKEKLKSQIAELRNILKRHINSERDWEEFKTYFDNVHPSFVNALRTRNADLSSTEIRLAALLKLNLGSKQIADMMGISPDSVKTARYRLRNKLDLEREQNLTQFLNHLEASELVRGT